MASQADKDFAELVLDAVALECRDVCPAETYKKAAKKYPHGIDHYFFEGPIEGLGSYHIEDHVAQRLREEDTTEPKPAGRVTRSQAKKGEKTLLVPCSARPTKGYSPILAPSSPGDESSIPHLSLDDIEQPSISRRDSGINVDKLVREGTSSSPRPLLYIGSDPEYNRDAMIARRSRSISLANAELTHRRSISSASSAGSGPKRIKSRMPSAENTKACSSENPTRPMRPGVSASAQDPAATFAAVTTRRQKRPSPFDVDDRATKRAKLNVVDLTASSDDKVEYEPGWSSQLDKAFVEQENLSTIQHSSPAPSLTNIDGHGKADLDSPQEDSSSDLSSPPSINSDVSFMASSPPVPQRSIPTPAAAPSAAPADYKHVVMTASTSCWTLRFYATAAKARARCQEHPIAVNHQKNKHRQKRNQSLGVGPAIDIGHGIKLYVMDSAHNSCMHYLLGEGVKKASEPWGRKIGRQRILGPERERFCEWVEGGGFGDNVVNVLPDVDAGIGSVPCLWFKINQAVEKLRRIETERKDAGSKQTAE